MRHFGELLRSSVNDVPTEEWPQFVSFLKEERCRLDARAERGRAHPVVSGGKGPRPFRPQRTTDAQTEQALGGEAGEGATAAMPAALIHLEHVLRAKQRERGCVGKLRERAGSDSVGGGALGDADMDSNDGKGGDDGIDGGNGIAAQYASWTRGHVLGTGPNGTVFRAQLWSSLEFVAVKEVC